MANQSLTAKQQEIQRLEAEIAQAEADIAAVQQHRETLKNALGKYLEKIENVLFAPEWLGDVVLGDDFFKQLTNVNQHRNGIGKIPRGTYCVDADFDCDTGEFRQLRLSVRSEETKQPSVYEKRGIVFLD